MIASSVLRSQFGGSCFQFSFRLQKKLNMLNNEDWIEIMDERQKLFQALAGIGKELQRMNETLFSMTTFKKKTQKRAARQASGLSAELPSEAKLHKETKSEERVLTGYGAEMAALFPQKRQAKKKTPTKKGSGYPKKPV
jgi:hypothetical protein